MVFGVRGRLTLVVVAALAAALAVATYGFNVLLAHSADTDANSLLRQRADGERGVLRIVGGHIRLAEITDDPASDARIWIFEGTKEVEAPRSATSSGRAARALLVGSSRYVDVAATDERLYAEPITNKSGTRIGTLVAGISVAPYEQARRSALLGSLALSGTLLLLAGAAVWWLLRSALRPVQTMTEQAAAWSERDLDRRFELGDPHDELTRLGATLDGLLDRLAASLRHERRFSAELSHELRTPLAKVIAEAELTLRRERDPEEYREALALVLRNAQHLARIVETLVAAARQEASGTRGTADAFLVARDVVESAHQVAETRGVELRTAQPTQTIRIGVDADLAERILQPVVDNACRYGRSRVDVDVTRRGSRIVYRVSDDGPGVRASEVEGIFEPGRRGDAGERLTGAGLGLALARRLARGVSGEVSAEAHDGGGRFTVELPAA